MSCSFRIQGTGDHAACVTPVSYLFTSILQGKQEESKVWAPKVLASLARYAPPHPGACLPPCALSTLPSAIFLLLVLSSLRLPVGSWVTPILMISRVPER